MMSKRKRKKPRHSRAQGPRCSVHESEKELDRGIAAVLAHLTSVSAMDAYLALLIGELWLPNISAQSRQALAVSVFVSAKASAFGDRSLNEYAEFSEFLSRLYALLPTFPMLDDYVPEPDWGQVRIGFEGKAYRLMYGGTIERIPDFVHAFRLAKTGGIPAQNDLRAVLTLQDYLLANIAQSGDVSSINPDHLEVPPKDFWVRARKVLHHVPDIAAEQSVSTALIARQGAITCPDDASFTTKLMAGELLPFSWIELEGRRFPVSPRNLCGVVIQYWEEREARPSGQLERDTAKQTANFLATRFRSADVVPGPMRVSLRHPTLVDLQVSAFLCMREVLWVVVIIDVKRAQDLASAEKRIRALIKEDDGLVAQDLATGRLLHMPLQGRPADAVRLIAVIVAPIAGASIPVPRSPALKTLFLVDLVSIVESVESMEDLEGYLAFVDANKESASPFVGPMDQFAAYRQSHGVLVGGAVRPSFIMLDVHGGSNFRFEYLRDFWASAPRRFPDDKPTTWSLKPTDGTLRHLINRSHPQLSWCADQVIPTLHFMLDAKAQDLELKHGELLELLVHCLADAWNERAELFPSGLLTKERIVTHCRANLDRLPLDSGGEPSIDPLLTEWSIREHNPEFSVLEVHVDLSQVAFGLEDASDAQFEAFCAGEWLQGACKILGASLDEQVLRALAATADRAPRFTLSHSERTVDVPEHPDPVSADPEHFKLARRDLAMEFRAEGVEPGRYELKQAKAVIDKIRDRYRSIVHERIRRFDQHALIRYGVEQFDQLAENYDRESMRLRMSRSHEVDFDRTKRQAKAHEEFVRTTRNVRYVLEFRYSSGIAGEIVPRVEDWPRLLAQVDWLLVLYGASDTLHNELEVGGIDVDNDFIPEVFYQGGDDKAYQQEAANATLEHDITEDRVSEMDEMEKRRLNTAFVDSFGFALSTLLQVLTVLSRWASANEAAPPLAWSYEAPKSDVVATLVAHFPEVSAVEAAAAVDFLTLDASGVRVLAGRNREEGDVPVWEHRKRVHRYAIRPLLQLKQDTLLWGAAAAYRAFGIWNGTFSDGYPPADFGYREIEDVARSIKRRIEYDLELRAAEVFSRHFTYFEHGIDFRSRFPQEGFDNVGDFDVLAYRPADNQWFMVECKYNKPPFCIKDARRLREEVFGRSPESGQLAKIARRHRFLEKHAPKILELLNWPAGAAVERRIEDLYVCPRIFPFMRRTPRIVSTQFVPLGKLGPLVRSRLCGGADPSE